MVLTQAWPYQGVLDIWMHASYYRCMRGGGGGGGGGEEEEEDDKRMVVNQQLSE
jgi:hypothetical protein